MNTDLERLENLNREKEKIGVKLPNLRKLKLSLIDVEKSYTTLYNRYSNYFKLKIDEFLNESNVYMWNVSPELLDEIIAKVLNSNTLTYVDKYNKQDDEYSVAKYLSKDKISSNNYMAENFECWEYEYHGYNDVVDTIAIPIPRNIVSDLTVNKKSRKSIYYSKNIKAPNKTKVLALEDVCAYIYLVNTAYNKYNELFSKNNNKYKPMYFNYFFENTELTHNNIESIIDIDRPVNLGWHSRYNQALIAEIFFYLKEEAEDDYLENEFNKKLSEDYAKSYQDLKNPTDKIISKMKNNPFNSYFTKVEIDSDIDLEKFHQSEMEWVNFIKSSLKKLIELPMSKPTLRFRKLGQHNATGLYYPTVNCICVDIRNISSFIHELGHCIDYTSGDTRQSKLYEFKRVINEYKYALKRDLKNSEEEAVAFKLTSKKESYFFNPTEIFARCFELYLSQSKMLTSSFLPHDYTLQGGYPNFKGSFSNTVNNYFDNFLDKYDIQIVNEVSTLKVVSNVDLDLSKATTDKVIKVEKPKVENLEHIAGDYLFLNKELKSVDGTIFLNQPESLFKNNDCIKEKEYNSTLKDDEAAIKDCIEDETYSFLTKELKEGTNGSLFLGEEFSFKVKTIATKEEKTTNLSVIDDSNEIKIQTETKKKKKKRKYITRGASVIIDGAVTELMIYTDKKNKNQYSIFDLI